MSGIGDGIITCNDPRHAALESQLHREAERRAEVERELVKSDGYILWSRTVDAIARVIRGESVASVFPDGPGVALCGGDLGPREICQEIESMRAKLAAAEGEVARLKNAATAWRDHRLSQTGDKRFFIDHGVIHDRQTGRHVRAEDPVTEEDGVEECCELLNRLADEQFTENELRAFLEADDARQQLASLETAAWALVEALPKCTQQRFDEDDNASPCTEIATRAFKRGADRFCDDCADIEHTMGNAMDPSHNIAPEYPRAAPLRALLTLLAASAKETT